MRTRGPTKRSMFPKSRERTALQDGSASTALDHCASMSDSCTCTQKCTAWSTSVNTTSKLSPWVPSSTPRKRFSPARITSSCAVCTSLNAAGLAVDMAVESRRSVMTKASVDAVPWSQVLRRTPSKALSGVSSIIAEPTASAAAYLAFLRRLRIFWIVLSRSQKRYSTTRTRAVKRRPESMPHSNDVEEPASAGCSHSSTTSAAADSSPAAFVAHTWRRSSSSGSSRVAG
mmetsp:Transcript_11229/g.21218  ORF Transcript_11229/g.21218 Transcript_11229/m.21218 type:complete len:230 (+) Transcript_11229:2269-2958(+)